MWILFESKGFGFYYVAQGLTKPVNGTVMQYSDI